MTETIVVLGVVVISLLFTFCIVGLALYASKR
jgi:preprotein translocase subunit SecE